MKHFIFNKLGTALALFAVGTIISESASPQVASRPNDWRHLTELCHKDQHSSGPWWDWAGPITTKYLLQYFRPVLMTYGDVESPLHNPMSGSDFLRLCEGDLRPEDVLERTSADPARKEGDTQFFLSLASDWKERLVKARSGRLNLPDQGAPVIYGRVWRLSLPGQQDVYSVLFMALFPFNYGDAPYPLPSDAFDHEGDWLAVDLQVRYVAGETPELIGVYSHSHGRQFYTPADRLLTPAGTPRFLSLEARSEVKKSFKSGVHLPLFTEFNRGEFWPYPGGPGTDDVEPGMSIANKIEKSKAGGLITITDGDQTAEHKGSNVIVPRLRSLPRDLFNGVDYRLNNLSNSILDSLLVARFAGKWGGVNDSPFSPMFQDTMRFRGFDEMLLQYPDNAVGEGEVLFSMVMLGLTAVISLLIIGAIAGALLGSAVIGLIVAGIIAALAIIAVFTFPLWANAFDLFDGKKKRRKSGETPSSEIGEERKVSEESKSSFDDGAAFSPEEERGHEDWDDSPPPPVDVAPAPEVLAGLSGGEQIDLSSEVARLTLLTDQPVTKLSSVLAECPPAARMNGVRHLLTNAVLRSSINATELLIGFRPPVPSGDIRHDTWNRIHETLSKVRRVELLQAPEVDKLFRDEKYLRGWQLHHRKAIEIAKASERMTVQVFFEKLKTLLTQ